MSFARVDIIKLGYFKWIKKFESCKASCTVTLVRDGDSNLIVDTGNPSDEKAIREGLRKFKLTPRDIDYVIITHYHPDHIGCNMLFKHAIFIDFADFYKGDKFNFFEKECEVTKNVKVIATPGHTYDSCSALVKCKEGIVAIVGDTFWTNKQDKLPAFYENLRQLKSSRKKILKLADYIIPGHANIFKVKK